VPRFLESSRRGLKTVASSSTLRVGDANGASKTTTRSARLQSCSPDTRAVPCAPLAPRNPPIAVAAPPTPAADLIIPRPRSRLQPTVAPLRAMHRSPAGPQAPVPRLDSSARPTEPRPPDRPLLRPTRSRPGAGLVEYAHEREVRRGTSSLGLYTVRRGVPAPPYAVSSVISPLSGSSPILLRERGCVALWTATLTRSCTRRAPLSSLSTESPVLVEPFLFDSLASPIRASSPPPASSSSPTATNGGSHRLTPSAQGFSLRHSDSRRHPSPLVPHDAAPPIRPRSLSTRGSSPAA